mmetsp:Transcript_54118/g.131333  ORF Transcript_54118/g.131333 Transcript_54118/m.131333 type:complete len:371 (+) Transcript_54118:120-1232(+)
MKSTTSTSYSLLGFLAVCYICCCCCRHRRQQHSSTFVAAYVTRSGGTVGGFGGLTEPWSPSHKVTPDQKPSPSPSSPQSSPSKSSSFSSTSIVDEVFRDEYETWAVRYGKEMSVHRFDIFKQNFMLQMQQNKRLGTFHLLNEFGDMTQVEYEEYLTEELAATETATTTTASTSTSTETTESTTIGGVTTPTPTTGVSMPTRDDQTSSSEPNYTEHEEVKVDTTINGASDEIEVEVELVAETEAELRRRHQQERGGGTSTTATSTGPTKVEPLFTNHDNVARSRGGAVPGSLNNDARTTTTATAASSTSTSTATGTTSVSSSYYPYSTAPTPPGPQRQQNQSPFREKYRTGGTQFLGVKKRLVRWTPGMPL